MKRSNEKVTGESNASLFQIWEPRSDGIEVVARVFFAVLVLGMLLAYITLRTYGSRAGLPGYLAWIIAAAFVASMFLLPIVNRPTGRESSEGASIGGLTALPGQRGKCVAAFGVLSAACFITALVCTICLDCSVATDPALKYVELPFFILGVLLAALSYYVSHVRPSPVCPDPDLGALSVLPSDYEEPRRRRAQTGPCGDLG
ncbi:hypothetical protein NHE_0079 [Neorickettsia helminthoeca str. Oregon]|uniref:Uncharacterized protein n=1 Tax=Neorickettsia helminthoeca str. Oregon TaxID=1286528 RepID=X5HL35_9RICK|nr:hypothetical protein [Neorickettsia helminthoeca]AHX11050.1 hypothetical protein NHE_0079 [Neorickettsia helminthoeca str. Oregon]